MLGQLLLVGLYCRCFGSVDAVTSLTARILSLQVSTTNKLRGLLPSFTQSSILTVFVKDIVTLGRHSKQSWEGTLAISVVITFVVVDTSPVRPIHVQDQLQRLCAIIVGVAVVVKVLFIIGVGWKENRTDDCHVTDRATIRIAKQVGRGVVIAASNDGIVGRSKQTGNVFYFVHTRLGLHP